MPLPSGVILDRTRHPQRSWPREPALPMTTPNPPGRGSSPAARVAPDGTRWCAYGDHTLDPDSRQRRCESCAQWRTEFFAGPGRGEYVALPADVVHAFIAAARRHALATTRLNGLVARMGEPTVQDIQDTHESAALMHSIAEIMREYLGRADG